MNMPNLPTDNLYKFLALAGLAIAVLSFWHAEGKLSEIKYKIASLEGDVGLMKVYEDALQKNRDSIRASIKRKSVSDEEMKELYKQHHEYLLKNAEFQAKTKFVLVLIEEGKRVSTLSIWIETIGVLISYIGFQLWYIRVQKPNDMLLRKQLEDLKDIALVTRVVK